MAGGASARARRLAVVGAMVACLGLPACRTPGSAVGEDRHRAVLEQLYPVGKLRPPERFALPSVRKPSNVRAREVGTLAHSAELAGSPPDELLSAALASLEAAGKTRTAVGYDVFRITERERRGYAQVAHYCDVVFWDAIHRIVWSYRGDDGC